MARGVPLSRRTVLGALLGWIPWARWAAAAPTAPVSGGHLPDLLTGFKRAAVHHRRYKANATILALGVKIFSRGGVGGGYAAVETGLSPDATATALQFSAGSWPDRAAGLNRFGILREAIAERSGHIELAFAGFITSSKEQSLGEARRALHSSEEGVPVTVAWGGTGAANIAHTTVPPTFQWTQAEQVLDGLLRDSDAEQKTSHTGNAPGFLSSMRAAGLSRSPAFQSSFLHNGTLYELRTKWKNAQRTELSGELRNQQQEVTARFQAHYQPTDPSGLPIRFDYHARSFLRLTFEADPAGTQPIPHLMTE